LKVIPRGQASKLVLPLEYTAPHSGNSNRSMHSCCGGNSVQTNAL